MLLSYGPLHRSILIWFPAIGGWADFQTYSHTRWPVTLFRSYDDWKGHATLQEDILTKRFTKGLACYCQSASVACTSAPSSWCWREDLWKWRGFHCRLNIAWYKCLQVWSGWLSRLVCKLDITTYLEVHATICIVRDHSLINSSQKRTHCYFMHSLLATRRKSIFAWFSKH